MTCITPICPQDWITHHSKCHFLCFQQDSCKNGFLLPYNIRPMRKIHACWIKSIGHCVGVDRSVLVNESAEPIATHPGASSGRRPPSLALVWAAGPIPPSAPRCPASAGPAPRRSPRNRHPLSSLPGRRTQEGKNKQNNAEAEMGLCSEKVIWWFYSKKEKIYTQTVCKKRQKK